MTARRSFDDATQLPGSMVGPGGSHDRDGVIIDARHAVILDTVEVCTVQVSNADEPKRDAIALVLGGRVNRTPKTAQVLFVMGTDGAAALVTQLIALYGRAGGDALQFFDDVSERMERLRQDGDLS